MECSGRADDQVKIRGFRIELGEIDTHLSQHPLVRENVTLLRRNKDEEPTLVSYFVPDQKPALDQLLSQQASTNPLKELVVLISSSGSNLQALIDSISSGILQGKARIKCVISNRKAAFGLERAQEAGIHTKIWSLAESRKKYGDSREKYDTELARLVLEEGTPDLVICAGFMHILSTQFLTPLQNAKVGIINLHPALPGQFNGAKAIERAHEAFKDGLIKKTGLMIHWVIAEVDMGQPILVREIPISDHDTLNSLQDTIHAEEHKLIVEATSKVIADMPTDTLLERMQKYQPLVTDIREYLKGKLASYAVPSVYVPMDKMPLNPNGKVDKPALPYPDTAQQAAIRRADVDQQVDLNPTQQAVHDIWREVLPSAPTSIGLEENFFDLGGHSMLATKLIRQVRTKFDLNNVPLGTVFDVPTIGSIARRLDEFKNGGTTESEDTGELAYAKDAKELCSSHIAKQYNTRPEISVDEQLVVFLTGATGFLGTFLIRELLSRRNIYKVIAHVRAENKAAGLQRLKDTLSGYGVWNDEWTSKITIVCGDLSSERLGTRQLEWQSLSEEVDCIIHNGAQVDWVRPYSKLRGPNVLGTTTALSLCESGKPKNFTFVSSTSVLDTEHYVKESDRLVALGEDGVMEADDMQGSAAGLGTGYGRSKWVSEYILREAGRRGLSGCIVRPGYIVGDSATGVTNTDDFIVRMIKSCVQIGAYPDIHNSVNMTPVDHVARVVCAATISPPRFSKTDLVQVAHVTGHPRSRFIDFLGYLKKYGFSSEKVDYNVWKELLETDVQNSRDNALYPLLDFVTNDLPSSTKAPEMDDRNTRQSLRADAKFTGIDASSGAGLRLKEMGTTLAFLVEIGYLDPPGTHGTQLPHISVASNIKEKFSKVGGRGASLK